MGNYGNEKVVSDTVEWYTPIEVFQSMGVVFDLDVASPGPGVVPWVPARRHLTVRDNGLTADWDACFVWCNPPWGRGIVDWVARFVAHAAAGNSGVMLLPVRTETGWWRAIAHAPGLSVMFVRGRVGFVSPDGKRPGAAGVGVGLFGFGEQGRNAVGVSAESGFGDVWVRG